MPRQVDEDLFESTKMTFGEHLEELRGTLLKSLLALAIGFLIGLTVGRGVVRYIQTPLRQALEEHYGLAAKKEYVRYLEQRKAEGLPIPEDIEAAAETFAEQGLLTEDRYIDPREVLEAVREKFPGVLGSATDAPPLETGAPVRREDLVRLRVYHDLDRDSRMQMVGLRAEDAFMVYMKASLVVGVILSSPFVFYFIWQFVAAGLYLHERRYVHIFLPFSLALFLAGAALAFFFVFQYVLAFLLWFYEVMDIDPELRINDWMSFVLILPLGFGISFQLPLVMLFLERIGIFTVASYLSYWRMAVLVIAFISMLLTPADPNSMLLMAVPLIFLYFFGVALCKLMPRRTTPFGEAIE